VPFSLPPPPPLLPLLLLPLLQGEFGSQSCHVESQPRYNQFKCMATTGRLSGQGHSCDFHWGGAVCRVPFYRQLQRESKKFTPMVFLKISPNGWEFFSKILYA